MPENRLGNSKEINRQSAIIGPIIEPFQAFLRTEYSGGILLLMASVLALVWANSPYGTSYTLLWQKPVVVGAGDFVLSKPFQLWINDGLMAMFFFVVGLEIKREVLAGELASWRKSALPLSAAMGGMALPALIYAVINLGQPGAPGWGIPMATDIAFSLAVLSFLGRRVPLSLKIFLAALAIADDLGAVMIIALFYTSTLSLTNLGVGVGFLGILIGANAVGIRHPLFYAMVGIGGVWLAFLFSGVHPTVAGVLAAWTIPSRPQMSRNQFLGLGRRLLQRFKEYTSQEPLAATSRRGQTVAHQLEDAIEEVSTPLHRLEHVLHPWVTGLILPLFALANAGVSLGSEVHDHLLTSVSLGVMVGLLVGKPLGVMGMVWVTIRMGIAEFPAGMTWRHLHGVAWLAGIGFTMSLFIAELAFGQSQLLTSAKIGVLVASVMGGAVGWSVLRRCPKS